MSADFVRAESCGILLIGLIKVRVIRRQPKSGGQVAVVGSLGGSLPLMFAAYMCAVDAPRPIQPLDVGLGIF